MGSGVLLFDGTPRVGVLLMVVGFLVLDAGACELIHKVIADAVSAGRVMAHPCMGRQSLSRRMISTPR